jgi:AraC-like DNA-binding protein
VSGFRRVAGPDRYRGIVRDGSLLAVGDGFSVAEVRCRQPRSGFTAPEETAGHALVFVRRGAFVRRVDGREVLLDSTVAYLHGPGSEQRCAHPVSGGDDCVVLGLSPGLLASLADGEVTAEIPAVPMDAASELAVRRITSLARTCDVDGALAERVVRTVAALISRGRPEVAAGAGRWPRGPGVAAAHGRLVQQVREMLLAEPGLGVIELGRRAGCSPHYLSRVFGRVTGSSISGYRTRIRVSQALDRIAQGESSLAALAHDLGFADHAHLTRTFRAVTGRTPTTCRGMLAG